MWTKISRVPDGKLPGLDPSLEQQQCLTGIQRLQLDLRCGFDEGCEPFVNPGKSATTAVNQFIKRIAQPRLFHDAFDLLLHAVAFGDRQDAMDRTPSCLRQHQAGQRRSSAARQPPTVIIAPPQTRQLIANAGLPDHAALRARQPRAAFRDRPQLRILRLPGRPEIRIMAPSIPFITQPVQRHAERFQVEYRRRFLRMATQQSHRRETESLARRRQRVQVIGVGAAKADDPLRT